MTARYAIYYAPADHSALAQFGKTVLRRTAIQAKRPCTANQANSFADPMRWSALTQVPARYGFHSTIKAPFELSGDASAAELLSATKRICTQFSCVELTSLCIKSTPASAFVALGREQPAQLSLLAAVVVKDLEVFRAPLMPADIARRRPETLSARQLHYLHEYGYPHVLEDFNFHMTLTGALGSADSDFVAWLEQSFNELVTEANTSLDRLAVFRQTSRETAFVRIAEFPFAGQCAAEPASAQGA